MLGLLGWWLINPSPDPGRQAITACIEGPLPHTGSLCGFHNLALDRHALLPLVDMKLLSSDALIILLIRDQLASHDHLL